MTHTLNVLLGVVSLWSGPAPVQASAAYQPVFDSARLLSAAVTPSARCAETQRANGWREYVVSEPRKNRKLVVGKHGAVAATFTAEIVRELGTNTETRRITAWLGPAGVLKGWRQGSRRDATRSTEAFNLELHASDSAQIMSLARAVLKHCERSP